MITKANGKPFTKQDECLKELGYAVIWMTYYHPELFTHADPKARHAMAAQKKRVETLIEEHRASNFKYEPTDKYWEEFLERIIDEIENMS